ncbi:DNA polymerase III subunit delta' [Vibrio sp. RC27]
MSLYPWLETSYELWAQSIESRKIPSATLLVAKPGMGMKAFVKQMAASALCRSEHRPCGYCHDCDLFAADNHPDFHQVGPENGAKSINVEQIRRVNRLAQESSQLGGYRVIAITSAHLMNESAANALLKTLEEPADNCCFILLTHSLSQLLPTIVSRCQQIAIPEPNQEQVAFWASTQTESPIPPYIVKLNGYAPLSVVDFMVEKQDKAFEILVTQFLQFLTQPDSEVLDLGKMIAKESDVHLTWLWYLLTDAQKYHFSVEQMDAIPHSANVSQLCTYPILYQQTQSLTLLLQKTQKFTGLNTELLVINWLLEFKG